MTVTELVQQAHANTSYRELSRRAAKQGHAISHTLLASWGAGEILRAPQRSQAEAIAAAVGVHYHDVVEAIYEQFYR